MSIKFVCRCGKHLRARDEMAARRSLCPRCGAPVGIPSLQPTHRGAPLGPMSPAERQQAALSSGLSATARTTAALPASTLSGRDLGSRASRAAKHGRETAPPPSCGWRQRHWVETRWYHCLLLPRRAWPLVLGLSFLMAGLCGGIALSLPSLAGTVRAEGSWQLGRSFPFFAIALLVFGYGSGFLDCVFASAVSGEVGDVRWPGRDVVAALKSGARWLICFLAGPAIPAGVSVLYWVRCGELALLDWMILAELNVVAVSAWFLLLLTVNQHQRLRDINPARVVALIQRSGHRLVALAVFSAVVALAHACLASVGVETIHHDVPSGCLWLFLSATSGMFFATFLFRWVGIWFYWERIRGTRHEAACSPQG